MIVKRMAEEAAKRNEKSTGLGALLPATHFADSIEAVRLRQLEAGSGTPPLEFPLRFTLPEDPVLQAISRLGGQNWAQRECAP
jgi:hypothetical protein